MLYVGTPATRLAPRRCSCSTSTPRARATNRSSRASSSPAARSSRSLPPCDTEAAIFVSSWDGSRIDVVDTTSVEPTKAVIKSIPVGKNLQAFTPLGTRYLAVVASDGDEISVLDTLPASVSEAPMVPVVAGEKVHGYAPSGASYDATAKRFLCISGRPQRAASFDVTPPKPTAPRPPSPPRGCSAPSGGPPRSPCARTARWWWSTARVTARAPTPSPSSRAKATSPIACAAPSSWWPPPTQLSSPPARPTSTPPPMSASFCRLQVRSRGGAPTTSRSRRPTPKGRASSSSTSSSS